tara:strand:- start:2105 stop:2362 length:258 start_codon:yes stop_codon:yes gene_type:complete
MNDDWLKKHKEIHDAFYSNPRDLERSGVHLRTFEKVSKLFENVVRDQAQAHDALSKSLEEMRFQRNVWLLWSLALLVLNVVFASI